jgi:demethylsterigmatocystin 6-O-methyltransferase
MSLGAQFYYLRHVLHDWPDAECIKILKNLASALRNDSHILIDEIVLPDVNARWQATMRDMSMNIVFGGKERTRSQWQSLVEQAGLRLLHSHDYSITQAESVIVLALP